MRIQWPVTTFIHVVYTCTYLLLSKARINDKHNTIDCQGGLSNVGGDHNLPSNGSIGLIGRSWLEYPLLQLGREGGVQGDALQVTHIRTQVLHFSLDALASLLNFLTGGNPAYQLTATEHTFTASHLYIRSQHTTIRSPWNTFPEIVGAIWPQAITVYRSTCTLLSRVVQIHVLSSETQCDPGDMEQLQCNTTRSHKSGLLRNTAMRRGPSSLLIRYSCFSSWTTVQCSLHVHHLLLCNTPNSVWSISKRLLYMKLEDQAFFSITLAVRACASVCHWCDSLLVCGPISRRILSAKMTLPEATCPPKLTSMQ